MPIIIPRHSQKQLSSFLSEKGTHHDVLMVEGARQVGKTTLVLAALNDIGNAIHINLEDNRILRKQIDQTSSFAEFESILSNSHALNPNQEQVLFIDEAQESSKLGSYVRFMKEKWSATRVILSGSSMTRLFPDDVRIPVGRFRRFLVLPFSFREFLSAGGKTALQNLVENFLSNGKINEYEHNALLEEMDRYLEIGGLPAVVMAFRENRDYRAIRTDIILSQEEDFIRKEDSPKKYLFSDAMKAVANNLGYPSKLVHVTQKTEDAKRILSVLKAWHLVLEIEQKGISTTTVFSPKRYLYDIGVAQDIRNMPFPKLSLLSSALSDLRSQLGGLFENLVLLSLLQETITRNSISSWKKNSKEQVEVDFIWRSQYPIPIECKASLRVTSRTFSNVQQYLNLSGLNVGFVVSAAPYQVFKAKGKTLINLPLYLATPEIIDQLFERHFEAA